MAIYKEDIVDINLETGNIHRSFLAHSIGYLDQKADHFGVRVFRGKDPVDLTGVSVQGIFMPPQGSPIAITSGNSVSGNVAYVVLPQACYNYNGQFCLAIKLVDSNNSITGTVRIVDGMVDNTHASGTVAPTSAVPTYQEILAQYDGMVAATAAANGAIAPLYANLTFPVKTGQYAIVDGALKRAIVDIATSEAYTSAHWTDAKIGPDVTDLKSAINPVVTNGLFTDSTMTTVSAMQGSNQSFSSNYGWFGSPIAASSVAKNSPFCNQLKITNASAATSLMGQDIDANNFVDGTYYFNAKIKSSTAITIRVSLIKYPSAVNSNGTSVQSDGISIPGDGKWHDVSHSFTLADISSDYNHLRVYVQFNSAVSVAMTEAYFGTDNYGYSYIENAIADINEDIAGLNDDIAGINDDIDNVEDDYNQKIAKVEEEVKINSEAFVPVVIRLDREDAVYTESDIINVSNGAITHTTLSGFNSAKWDISSYVGRTLIVSGISYTAALSWIITDTNGTALTYAQRPASGTLKNLDTVKIPDDAKYLYYCGGSDSTHIGALNSMTPMIVTGYENNVSGTGSNLVDVDPSWEVDGKFLQTAGTGAVPVNTATSGYAVAMIRVLRGHTYHVHSARIYKQSSYVLTDEYFATKASDYSNTQESVTTLTVYDGDVTPTEDGWLLYQTKVNNVEGFYCSAYGGASSLNGNVLYGKKLVTAGDSYTAADFSGDYAQYNKKNFGYYIAKRNNMRFVNSGISGSTMAVPSNPAAGDKSPFSYQRYLNVPADTDYLTIWFGINDNGSTSGVQNCTLGTIDDTENTTFYGAWNKVLKYYIENRPFMKVLIIVTTIAGWAQGNTRDFQQAIRDVAEKWGYPYMDWVKDTSIPAFFEREGMCTDALTARREAFGWNGPVASHPNPAWHEYESTIIEAKLRSI